MLSLEKIPLEVQWLVLRHVPKGLLALYQSVNRAWRRAIRAYFAEHGFPTKQAVWVARWRVPALADAGRPGMSAAKQKRLAGRCMQAAFDANVPPRAFYDAWRQQGFNPASLRAALREYSFPMAWVAGLTFMFVCREPWTDATEPARHSSAIISVRQAYATCSTTRPCRSVPLPILMLLDDDNVTALNLYGSAVDWRTMVTLDAPACLTHWLWQKPDLAGNTLERMLVFCVLSGSPQCLDVVAQTLCDRGLGDHLRVQTGLTPRWTTWTAAFRLVELLPNMLAALRTSGMVYLWKNWIAYPTLSQLKAMVSLKIHVPATIVVRMLGFGRNRVDAAALAWLETEGLAYSLQCHRPAHTVRRMVATVFTPGMRSRYSRRCWNDLQRLKKAAVAWCAANAQN